MSAVAPYAALSVAADPTPALVDVVRRRLVAEHAVPTRARLAGAVAEAGVIGGDAVLGAVTAVADELVGLGPLAALLADPDVTDVVVNGADDVWIDRGGGLERVAVRLADDAAVRRLAERLTAQAGRRLDDALPYADVTLPRGVRLHAVLPPVSPRPLLSLRVPREQAWSLDDLVAVGALPPALADVLASVVRAKVAFLVTGGTGTGKTTLLAGLLGRAAPTERVVLVEELPELRPALPHVVRLQARTANAEGAGEITLSDLVRQTLRMRPDRIVVGEARGAEVVDLLRALNSGHEGGCGTLHANGIADVPARVEALATAAGVGRAAAHSLLASAVDVVVHLVRDRSGQRRVSAVGVLDRGADGLVFAVEALVSPSGGGALERHAGASRLERILRDRGEPWPL
jgi:pilus assembly protein CpaF